MLYPTLIYTNARGESITFGALMTYHVDIADCDGLMHMESDIHTISTMGQDGETYVDSRIRARDITIRGALSQEDPDLAGRYRRRLATVLSPRLSGTLTYAGDVTRSIAVRVRSAPQWGPGDIYPTFALELKAASPFWTDQSPTVTQIALWEGLLEFPEPEGLEIVDGEWQIERRAPSLIVNLINLGDVESGMEITFTALGQLTNPSIIQVITQQYIRFNVDMEAGDVLKIRTGYREKSALFIRDGVETDAFSLLDLGSTFLQAQPGDNLLRYAADSGQDNLEVTIRHSNRYLTV